MNPKALNAVVAVAAFALGALAMHQALRWHLGRLERAALAEAAALGQAQPIDLDAIGRFADTLERRRPALSPKVRRDAVRTLLAGVEAHAFTTVDERAGVYDHAQFTVVIELLRRHFGDWAEASQLTQVMRTHRAMGIERCGRDVPAQRRMQAMADCVFVDPELREQARRELAAKP